MKINTKSRTCAINERKIVQIKFQNFLAENMYDTTLEIKSLTKRNF